MKEELEMATNSTTTAAELLKVMATRLAMQQKGITNPPEIIMAVTKTLVEQLTLLPNEEKVSIFIDEKCSKYIQQSTGRVLAEVPRSALEE